MGTTEAPIYKFYSSFNRQEIVREHYVLTSGSTWTGGHAAMFLEHLKRDTWETAETPRDRLTGTGRGHEDQEFPDTRDDEANRAGGALGFIGSTIGHRGINCADFVIKVLNEAGISNRHNSLFNTPSRIAKSR